MIRSAFFILNVLLCFFSTAQAETPAPPPAPSSPLSYGAPITLDAARKVMAAAETEAKKNGWFMVITILDSTGHLVLAERMDNTQYASIDIAQAKAETAVNFRRATKGFYDTLSQGGSGLRYLSMPGMTAVQGGELLTADGKIVGSIGVSGGSSDQDQQVALAGAAVVNMK